MKAKRQSPKHNINEHITFDEMQVITNTGENLGVISKKEAIRIADQDGLDLVLVTPSGKDGYAIAKIMDFGKVLYAKKKQMAEAKKKQTVIQVKEVRLTPKIGDHDLYNKMKQAAGFLEDGKHVKFNIRFKGREMATKNERGQEIFDKIENKLIEFGVEKFNKENDSKTGKFWSRVYYLKK